MDRVNPLPSKRVLLAAGVFLLVMLAVGSFADYPISKAVYNETDPMGMLLAGFGEYPAALGFAAAGAMLVSARNREKQLTGVVQTIAGCWFILSGGAMAALLLTGYLDIPVGLAVLIGVGCTGLTVWGVLLLCRGADHGTVLRVAASRIVMGAHYLSDTAVGFAVGLAVLTAVCRLLFPAGKGQKVHSA